MFYISNKYNKINPFTNRSTIWFKWKLNMYKQYFFNLFDKTENALFFSIKSERLMFYMNNKMDVKTKISHTSFNVFFGFWIWFRFHHQLSHVLAVSSVLLNIVDSGFLASSSFGSRMLSANLLLLPKHMQ